MLTQFTWYDQLGRVYQTRDATGNTVQVRYYTPANTGFHYQLSSNPYVTQSDATMGWTRTKFDANGRVVEVAHFSGSALPSPWGSNTATTGAVTTSYTDNRVMVTDEAGVTRTRYFDGLGRLIQTDEGGIAASTEYSYDALDNLTAVDTVRSYAYTSLGQLASATNPETGTITYTYDANGNVATRVSGSLTTTYGYNVLDQVTSKTYSDSTPTATWAYSKGWPISVSSTVSSTSYTNRDGLGRITATTQSTNNVSYPLSYGYNLADGMTAMTLPSGRVLTLAYDHGGRVSNLYGTLNGMGSNYVSAQYGPDGQVSQMTLGNWGLTDHRSVLYEQRCYNARLQLSSVRLRLQGTTTCGSAADANDLGLLTYSFGANNNNGNVTGQTIVYGASGAYSQMSFTQTYSYDGANRLASALETGGGGQTFWSQTFCYDKAGNRWVTPTSDTIDPMTPKAVCTGPGPYDSNNRMTGSEAAYDGRGNQTEIGGYARQFDAENRLTSSTIWTTSATYQYDGEGRRVTKVSGGLTTVYVYDVQGQLAAEYTSGGMVPSPPCTTCFLLADNVGSTRIMADSGSGQQAQLFDYLPFGEELGTLIGSRDARWGATAAAGGPVRFTGMPQDSYENAYLHYFGARYYSGGQGRFTSPDQPFNDQDPMNPQSWNLYSYVMNNPLRFTDPDGQAHTDDNGYYVGDKNGECQTIGGGTLCWSAKNNQWEAPPPPPPIITMSDLNPLDGGPPLAFQGFVNLFLNGQGKRGGAQLALGLLPSALVSFGAARMGGQQLFQGFQAAEDTALAAKGLSAGTAFNAGKGVINGETTGMTNHALSQALARGVTKQEVAEALTHVAKSTGGSVLKFIGQGAEVRVNQITGKIVTVIRFSSATAK